jgi:hypothetical protein
LVCEFSCFSVPQSLRGFWHWLLLWFLWVPLQLRGHWFGGRVYTLFPPLSFLLEKKKKLYLLHCFCCFGLLWIWFVFCTLNLLSCGCFFFFSLGHKFILCFDCCC